MNIQLTGILKKIIFNKSERKLIKTEYEWVSCFLELKNMDL